MTQTATTVSIVSPLCTASLDGNGLIVLTPIVPEQLVTHTMTWDSITVQAFVARSCDLAHYTPLIPDVNNPGQFVTNPTPSALPALQHTQQFWMAEAAFKAAQMGNAAQAAAVAASVASALGSGLLGIT